MFQPSVETMPAEERAALQEQRLDALVTRLMSSDNPYWQQKLAGLEGSELESLPFTVKAELRDQYPFGTLAVPLADTVRVHASSGTRGKPTIVACTPSFALLLAERAEAEGMLDRIDLRFGAFGAAPWSEAVRAKLEQAWGMDACDMYGLSEIMGPGVASECREEKGALHVFDDHFLPEIVDPETGRATDGRGELVLTTLTKEAFPVLRYRTGDVTSSSTSPARAGARTGGSHVSPGAWTTC